MKRVGCIYPYIANDRSWISLIPQAAHCQSDITPVTPLTISTATCEGSSVLPHHVRYYEEEACGARAL